LMSHSKGPGRLLIRGEHQGEGAGLHQFGVRVPDGYRPTYATVWPIEDQPVGDTEVIGWVYTVDNLPPVTTGSYYNGIYVRYSNGVASARGVFYQIFIEPVDGSDLHVEGSL